MIRVYTAPPEYQIRVYTAPTEYPVSLAKAKAALLVDHDQDDGLISDMIGAATKEAEKLAARSFVTRTMEMSLKRWPCDGAIPLPYPPVASITQISYYDEDNAEHVVTASVYQAILDLTPPLVVLARNQTWPTDSLRSIWPIRVRYVAGYGLAGAVDDGYKRSILGLVAVDYEHRESISTLASTQRKRIEAALRLDWGWA